MRRLLVPAVLLTLTAASSATLAACGSSDEQSAPRASDTAAAGGSSGSSGSTGAAGGAGDGISVDTGAAQVIDVTFDGDSVTPNGERVQVQLGRPVELHVTADSPGEIHVHSSPEQELEYTAGTSTLTLAPITVPGIIEVESHALDKVIVSLQVQ